MTRKKRVLIISAGVLVGLLLLKHPLELQLGLNNRGQEFGTYGPYNRALRVARSMNEFTVGPSRLSRRLDWRHIWHLDSFAIELRDSHGRTAEIVFAYGTSEMNERDTTALEQIIRSKFSEAANRGRTAED